MDAFSRSSDDAIFDDDDGLATCREVSSSLKELTVRVEGKGESCCGSTSTGQLPNMLRSKHSATEQCRHNKINDRVCQGTAFVDIPGGHYYPAVSTYTLPNEPNYDVGFNFGPDFEFFPEEFGGLPMSEVPYQAYVLKNEGPAENGIVEKAG